MIHRIWQTDSVPAESDWTVSHPRSGPHGHRTADDRSPRGRAAGRGAKRITMHARRAQEHSLGGW